MARFVDVGSVMRQPFETLGNELLQTVTYETMPSGQLSSHHDIASHAKQNSNPWLGVRKPGVIRYDSPPAPKTAPWQL